MFTKYKTVVPKRINYFIILLGDCLPLHLSVACFIFNPVQFQIMRSIARHTIALGRVFTLAFLFASSGFTTILHICAMETCECCDTSGACDDDACHNKNLPIPVTGMSIHNLDDCNITIVVGGFAVVQALVKKDIETQNIEALSLLTVTFVSPAPSNTSSWFTYSHLESVSPSSVEKYVLNETFLI